MKEENEKSLTMRTAIDHLQLRRLSHPNNLCKIDGSPGHPPMQSLNPPLDRPTLPPIAVKLENLEPRQLPMRYGGSPNFFHPFDSSQGPITVSPPYTPGPQSRRSSTTSTRQTSDNPLRPQNDGSNVSKTTRDRRTMAAVINTCKVPLSPQEASKAVAKAERADKKKKREQDSRRNLSEAIALLDRMHKKLGITKYTQLNTQNSQEFKGRLETLHTNHTKEETLLADRFIMEEVVKLPEDILASFRETVTRKLKDLHDQKQMASQGSHINIHYEESSSNSSRSSPSNDSGFGSE